MANTAWNLIEDKPGSRTLRLSGVELDSTSWASEPVEARAFTWASLLAVDASTGAGVAWGSGVLAVQSGMIGGGQWTPKFGFANMTKRIVSGAATEIGATTAATLTGFGLLTAVDITDDALLRVLMTTGGTANARADLLLTLVNPLTLGV